MKPISEIHLGKKTANDILNDYFSAGGFSSRDIPLATDILEKMIKDKSCTRILSLPSDIVATGQRGLIADALKYKWFNAVIATTGLPSHDLIRVWGAQYYYGDFSIDDHKLGKNGIYRLGNILLKSENYGRFLEDRMSPILEKFYKSGKRVFAPYEIIWEFGREIEEDSKIPQKLKEESILYWSWKNKIPIFVPGITDGAFGSQLFFFSQSHAGFDVSVFKDEEKLAGLIFDAKKLGALMIGGGISKHHTIWWAQFNEGLQYAVYITSASEQDGSLSGARLREAVSWGKVNQKAKYITVQSDATIVLPIILNAVYVRLNLAK
ncbi:MAG: deoxyhypusine synthase [Euryarchaeota archaeon HGW-Euryarchaeota-1]|nr:MAG: deoxyhypusine synthase [Euryarchaeota archaeon HGW-Euryarchaeota-1]